MFVDWYTNSSYSTKYDFNSAVTSDLNLCAKWETLNSKIQSVNGYNESLAVVWEDANPSSSNVRYRKTGGSWQNADKPLIRNVDGYARVDVVGLTAGEYEVEITTSSGDKLALPAPVTVEAYDRSGYAHFDYDEGVGAYTDNGVLKNNSLAIYLTESNKNTVNEGHVNGIKIDLTPYLTDESGTAAQSSHIKTRSLPASMKKLLKTL